MTPEIYLQTGTGEFIGELPPNLNTGTKRVEFLKTGFDEMAPIV